MIHQPLITKCFASKSRVEYLVPAQSGSAALYTSPASTKVAGYSKQQETPSPIPAATLSQQPWTWVVTAAPTGTEAAEIHIQDGGAVQAGPTTTTTIPNTKDATAVATSFSFTTPKQQVGGDYNNAVAQQRQGPDTIPSLDTVGLFSLIPLITSTIPSPTAITTTSSTITTPMTTSRIQYSKPGKAGAPFTSGQAVSTFSATVTSNTLIASAYTPTRFETVIKPKATASATVAAVAQEEDDVCEE